MIMIYLYSSYYLTNSWKVSVGFITIPKVFARKWLLKIRLELYLCSPISNCGLSSSLPNHTSKLRTAFRSVACVICCWLNSVIQHVIAVVLFCLKSCGMSKSGLCPYFPFELYVRYIFIVAATESHYKVLVFYSMRNHQTTHIEVGKCVKKGVGY